MTGLTHSCSLNLFIYKEIEAILLDDRRKYQKLIMAFKLKQILLRNIYVIFYSESVGFLTPYNLRINSDITSIHARTHNFKK